MAKFVINLTIRLSAQRHRPGECYVLDWKAVPIAVAGTLIVVGKRRAQLAWEWCNQAGISKPRQGKAIRGVSNRTCNSVVHKIPAGDRQQEIPAGICKSETAIEGLARGQVHPIEVIDVLPGAARPIETRGPVPSGIE